MNLMTNKRKIVSLISLWILLLMSYMYNISYGSYSENIYLNKNNELNEEPGIITQQNNTNLETLAIENTLLYPAFNNNITNYNAEVSNNTISLNILAIPEIEGAKVEIVKDNELNEGDNLIIINVTAKDGITKEVYKVHVYRRSQEEEILYEQKELENQKKLEQIYNEQEQIYNAQKMSSNIITYGQVNEKNNIMLKSNELMIILGIIIVVFVVVFVVGKLIL